MGILQYHTYINVNSKFVRFMSNPIIENALYHTYNDPFETDWIICTKEDFREVLHLVHPKCRPHVLNCIRQMNHGITFSFWIEDNQIVFEG